MASIRTAKIARPIMSNAKLTDDEERANGGRTGRFSCYPSRPRLLRYAASALVTSGTISVHRMSGRFRLELTAAAPATRLPSVRSAGSVSAGTRSTPDRS